MVVLSVNLRGNVSARSNAGSDVLPASDIERAMLLLIVLGSEHRRSRKWLMSHLWSTRHADQASASLRSLLYKLRKSSDFWAEHLKSDRHSVWISGEIAVEFGDPRNGLLLEDLTHADPAFKAWLRDYRYSIDGALPERSAPTGPKPEIIHIRCAVPQTHYEARFLSNFFVDSLSSALRTYGEIEIEFANSAEMPSDSHPETPYLVEIESALADQDWFVHARVFHGPKKAFVWSGRLRLPMDLAQICNGPQVSNFVGRIISALVANTGPDAKNRPYFAIQNAAQKIFLGDREQLELASRILNNIGAVDLAGVSKSWKSYALLTKALEFGEMNADVIDEAIDLSNSALDFAGENALVTALAAQVQMKLAGDRDFGAYLAHRAVTLNDQNPYALHSATQAHLFAGEHKEAHQKALFARTIATSLPNSYYWDLLCCFTALSIGELEEARKHAIQAHSIRPNYRPALRYAAALSALAGRHADAEIYAARLQKIEPGFRLENLLRRDYPLETLRVLGHDEPLASRLTEVR